MNVEIPPGVYEVLAYRFEFHDFPAKVVKSMHGMNQGPKTAGRPYCNLLR